MIGMLYNLVIDSNLNQTRVSMKESRENLFVFFFVRENLAEVEIRVDVVWVSRRYTHTAVIFVTATIMAISLICFSLINTHLSRTMMT